MSGLWQETPLIRSQYLSRLLGCQAYLKLDCLQPSHSFKHRGLSLFVQRAKEKHGPSVHVIVASGGNAGLATASAANALGVRCTVYLSEATESTLSLIRGENASVQVVGTCYAESLQAARDMANAEEKAVLVHAYDNPILWEGHGSMITEISTQLDRKPDAIMCSVGGGGLLGGIITGCKEVGWDDVPIVALETEGSNCFHYSTVLNGKRSSKFSQTLPPNVTEIEGKDEELKLAYFSAFSSMASGSLGAPQPAERVLKMALEREGGIKCATVPDELSMHAALSFARDHKLLVELSCATTLAAAYNPSLFNKLVVADESTRSDRVVVFIVCGGFKVSLRDLVKYEGILEESFKTKGSEEWKVVVDDGEEVVVPKTSL